MFRTRVSSLETIELLLAIIINLSAKGFFTDWRTATDLSLPVLHIVNACLMFRPSFWLALLTMLDLVAFAYQYGLQFGALDATDYKFDPFNKTESDAKNYTKLAMLGALCAVMFMHSLAWCMNNPSKRAKRAAGEDDEDGDIVEETTSYSTAPPVRPHYTIQRPTYHPLSYQQQQQRRIYNLPT